MDRLNHHQQFLRLVGAQDERRLVTDNAARSAGRVQKENLRARELFAEFQNDPRWTIAMRAYSQLQNCVMTPSGRKNVHDLAHRLNIKRFDANLLIAVAQEHKREGGTLATLSRRILTVPISVEGTQQEQYQSDRRYSQLLAIACGMACILAATAIRWIVHG
ncbi:MAG TPA: hypothetical protein VG711_07465 [Phycisphaerales bacterium]|nr:hypothetical protein [Phycisphaerales bacterium]